LTHKNRPLRRIRSSGVPWGVACRTAPGVVAPAILTGVAGAGAVIGVSADVVGVAPGVGIHNSESEADKIQPYFASSAALFSKVSRDANLALSLIKSVL
jgi:hypothetical protein